MVDVKEQHGGSTEQQWDDSKQHIWKIKVSWNNWNVFVIMPNLAEDDKNLEYVVDKVWQCVWCLPLSKQN